MNRQLFQTLTKKPLYVCSLCGLNFTRRYNSDRHNQNLHSNKAENVTLMEYLSGRMSGKYLPGNPFSYRKKNRSKKEANFAHDYENDKTDFKQEKSNLSCNKTLCDNAEQSKENRMFDTNNANSNFKSDTESVVNPFNNMNYFTFFQAFEKKAKETGLILKIEEMFNDVERMLRDFYTYERAQIIIAQWKDRFNATTDYTGFYRELNEFRTALANRYLYP
jgi:hypothetical protein